MTSPQTAPQTTAQRTAPEATALLVELGRALRGRSFYEPGSRELQAVVSRAIRLWVADLRRCGALEVEVSEAGVRVPALAHQVPKLHLGGLAERLALRGVESLAFSRNLDADAVAAFVELVASEPRPAEGTGGFARALYACVPAGIAVNGEEPQAWADAPEPPAAPAAGPPALEEIEPGPEIPPETFEDADRDVSGFDFAPGELRTDHDAGSERAPGLDYSLSDAELELEIDDEVLTSPELETGDEPARAELPSTDADDVQLDAIDDTTLETVDETGTIELAAGDESPIPEPAVGPARYPDESYRRAEAREDTDTDVLREIPFEDTDATPALDPDGDGRWNQLRSLLSELERCTEDFRYNDLARRAEQLASSLADEGRSEAGIRAIRLFVQHAGDAAKRSPRQRDVASEQLERLVTGSRLEDLIELSCGDDAAVALDASQLLLAAGKPVVAPLLRMALRERKPARRGQLQAILIAMGDLLLPELLRALDAEDVGELRAAARLAGECQNPATVDRLEELLMHPEPSLRQEVAKALARVGDARSTEALARALQCPLEGVPTSAAYCLGSSGSGRAVEALLAALLAALESGEFGFAGEVIRSLGRLGRPEATPDLSAILLHRGMRKRRQYRELKLAAASALGRIPGDAAAGALAQAAQARDAQLRRAAQTALDRRRGHLGD
jgi:HEAT repeat protein